jgi:hypothetical protein
MKPAIQIDLATLLLEHEAPILKQATEALSRARLTHYQSTAQENEARVRTLFERTVRCAGTRSLLPMISYSEQLARQRYSGGFDLSEVQTAYNILEEAIWRCITDHVEPSAFPHAFGISSAILGAGKEALAREYVSLASQKKVQSLDVTALFAGV